MIQFIREKLFTPKYEKVDALPPTHEFAWYPHTYSKYLSVPMQSGRRALYRYEGSRTPLDPGDLHVHNFTFIKYLTKGE